MALTNAQKQQAHRDRMAEKKVKELRGVEVPKSMEKPTEKELKGRIAFLVKQFLKGK
jgi:hypothetical protein